MDANQYLTDYISTPITTLYPPYMTSTLQVKTIFKRILRFLMTSYCRDYIINWNPTSIASLSIGDSRQLLVERFRSLTCNPSVSYRVGSNFVRQSHEKQSYVSCSSYPTKNPSPPPGSSESQTFFEEISSSLSPKSQMSFVGRRDTKSKFRRLTKLLNETPES